MALLELLGNKSGNSFTIVKNDTYFVMGGVSCDNRVVHYVFYGGKKYLEMIKLLN